jgi:hypothetical protein
VDLLGMTFPTTTKLLFEITSTWRVFSRLVVVVMLGLVLLASMGVLWLVRGRARLPQAAIVALVLAVVVADLWARPPDGGTNRIVVPPTYERLAALPDGIAAEYPLLPAESSSYGDVFYQGWHDKPILNGYRVGPDENRALRLTELDDPATARGLEALGVRYVLLRRDLEAAGLPDPGRPGREYRFVTEDDYIALYELRQPGPQVLATPADGFGPPEVGPRQRSHWLVEPEGTIALRGTCAPCEGTVRLRIGSFERPRIVAISGPDGRPLARVRAPVNATRAVAVHVRFDRKAELRIETSPGPEPISRATGSADPRSVSIHVGAFTWQFEQGRR